MKQVTAILLGAGHRGAIIYGQYALSHPDEIKFVAVAEPCDDRREAFASAHHIPAEYATASWEELLKKNIKADCVFVCTHDRAHYEPTMLALDKGYHVLCEKPMSTEKHELINLCAKSKESNRTLSICHGLRYSPLFVKLKELLDGGAIGQLTNIQHTESVAYWHMAHSFVRGNWRREDETSPMILQKCCHDLDILCWLVGSPLKTVSSFGSLSHFRPENKPEGSPAFCLDGCTHKNNCPYYAPRFYLENPMAAEAGFDQVLSMDKSREGILKALEKGPFGRCVYSCDNTVVDHQVVNMCYENGVTVSMTMSAFTQQCERSMVLMGSHGQIFCNIKNSTIELWEFATGNSTLYHIQKPIGTHSGTDSVLVQDFLSVVRSGGTSRTNAESTVEGHLAALAAEDSRLHNGAPVSISLN